MLARFTVPSALAVSALWIAPACAGETYGPVLPAEAAAPDYSRYARFSIQPEETLEMAETRLARETRSAWTKFWIGQSLAGADVALTCIALTRRNPDGSARFREGNPIYGKDATCGQVAAIRGGLAAVQYLLARRSIGQDPARAGKHMNIVVAVQGVPVIWNAVQLAK